MGLLECLWGARSASWGLSWGQRLGMSVHVPPLGSLWAPSWGSLGRLGNLWGRLGALLGCLGGLLGRLGALLGRLGGLLGRLVAILRASWVVLGLGASGSRNGEKARILQKPMENQ